MLILVFVLVIRRKNIKTYFFEKKNLGVSIVLLIGVCANFFLLLLFGIYLSDGQLENTKLVILMIVIFVEVLQMIFISALVILVQSRKAAEETLKQQKTFFEELDQKNQDIRQFKHDFFAHMTAMKGMVKNDEIDKLAEYVMELDRDTEALNYINTGNSLASTFVNRACQQAKREGISFAYIGEFPREMKRLTDMELSSLLYNVLQNALEAAQKTCGERKILMEVSTDEEYIYLNVTNPAAEINAKGLRLLTTKIDGKNHGIGMRRMKVIAEKTGGILRWEFQDGKFHIFISIGR
jgi:sensor histidine kinase regulating citrate/malate metabolism